MLKNYIKSYAPICIGLTLLSLTELSLAQSDSVGYYLKVGPSFKVSKKAVPTMYVGKDEKNIYNSLYAGNFGLRRVSWC